MIPQFSDEYENFLYILRNSSTHSFRFTVSCSLDKLSRSTCSMFFEVPGSFVSGTGLSWDDRVHESVLVVEGLLGLMIDRYRLLLHYQTVWNLLLQLLLLLHISRRTPIVDTILVKALRLRVVGWHGTILRLLLLPLLERWLLRLLLLSHPALGVLRLRLLLLLG